MVATIADVARRARVSTATVSRVLAGLGHARPETRERILAAARDLDYRPSGVARSLQRRSTQTLGLIVTDIENPYFPQLVRAVEDAARAEGYTILLCNAADDPERESGYLDLLVERRVDGLIIAASSLGARHREWLAVAAAAGRPRSTPTAADVRPAVHPRPTTAPAARLAAAHLLDLGHRRFGYLMPPPRNVDAPERFAGLRDALVDAGLDPDAIADRRAARRWSAAGRRRCSSSSDRAPRITAVLAYNDLMAIGALRAIRRRGRSIPGDVSVVGFDDVALAAYVDPPLTTLSQSTAEMGHWAVERLAERLAAVGAPRPTTATARTVVRGRGADRRAPGPSRGARLDRSGAAG